MLGLQKKFGPLGKLGPSLTSGGGVPPTPVYAKLPINAIVATAGDSLMDPPPGFGQSKQQNVYQPHIWFNLLAGSPFRTPAEYQFASGGSDSSYLVSTVLPALQAMAVKPEAIILYVTNDIDVNTFNQYMANVTPLRDGGPWLLLIHPVGEGSYWTPSQLAQAKAINAGNRSLTTNKCGTTPYNTAALDDPANTRDGNHFNQYGARPAGGDYLLGPNVFGTYDVLGDFDSRIIKSWDMSGEDGGGVDTSFGGTGSEGSVTPTGITVYPPTGINVAASKVSNNVMQLVVTGTYTGDLANATVFIEGYIDTITTSVGSKSEAMWQFKPISTTGLRSAGQQETWFVGETQSTQGEVFAPLTEADDPNAYNNQSALPLGNPLIQRTTPIVQPSGGDTLSIDGVLYLQVGIPVNAIIQVSAMKVSVVT